MTPERDAAFSLFVREHGDSLLRYARLLTADRHEAEDALQTALLRLARHWDRDLRAPVAYCRTALRNLAIDGMRRRHLMAVPSDAGPGPAGEPDLAEAETAAVLHCSTGTVKSNLSRGLAALRQRLADQPHERSCR